MKASLTIALTYLIAMALAVGAEILPSTRQLASADCSSHWGRMTYVLSDYFYDKSPDVRLATYIRVLAVEGARNEKESRRRIWQYAMHGVKNMFPGADYAGALLCEEGSAKAWLFIVTSSGVGVIVNAYSVDLEREVDTRLPTSKMLADSATPEEAHPRPIISLVAQAETCLLDKVEASWDKERIALSLGGEKKPCESFQLRFDPKNDQFQDIPKDWFRVRTKKGGELFFP